MGEGGGVVAYFLAMRPFYLKVPGSVIYQRFLQARAKAVAEAKGGVGRQYACFHALNSSVPHHGKMEKEEPMVLGP